MLRTFKILGWSGLLLASLSTARAYSFFGPVSVDTWQVPELGYMLAGDLGAPKDSGQEYRWNIPTLYYSFHQNFLTYFGSNGVRAVSQAFNAFNALTNASAVDLSKFPVAVKRQNYRAQADGLLDLKSYTMELLIEQLGLADPIRYAWTLHNRYLPAGVTCPGSGIMYLVVNRNFDVNPSALDQAQPSSRVNGVLYTYQIVETCIPPNPLAWAAPVAPDPYYTYAPVASMRALTGDFYTGLTRDDAAGLGYLFSSNNINFEAVSPGVDLLVTNPPVFLSTSNLVQLVSDTSTNNPAALQALYPSLQFFSSPAQYTNQVTTNYTFYYTNYAWTAGGAVPVLVSLTNYTTNIGTFYRYQFANVVTNPGPPSYTTSNPPYTNSYVTIIYTNIVPAPYVTPGLVVTNVYVTNITVNAISGDYYIIPTNACGGLVVASNQLSLLVLTTNAPEFVPGPPLLITNTATYLTTSNLAQLVSDSTTNGPAALQALHPGLEILNYFPSLTNQVTTNYTFYYTNYSWTATGAVPVLVALTNYTTNIGTYYQYQFGNVITNPGPPDYTTSHPAYTNAYVTITYTNIVAGSYVTPGEVVTNVYVTNVTVNALSGDYYIIPTTNTCGGWLFNSNQLSLLVTTTNATEYIPAPQLLITNPINYFTTSNLTQLLSDSATNGPAALQALYPSLQITNYVPSFTLLVTTNLTPFYTNYPWGIPGQPPVVAYATNYSTNIGFVYQYKFGNVLTSSYSPFSLVTVLITNVTPQPWAVGNAVATNVYTSNYWANIPSGDYYITPTNNGCGSLIILSNILSQVTVVTNGTQIATNNLVGSVFTNNYYSETTTTYFTNHNFAYFLITCYSNPAASSLTRTTYFTNRNLAYYPVTCYSNPVDSSLTRITYFTNRNLRAAIVSCETSNAPALRRGIEKVSFIRRDFDSLLGQAFQPATNFFPMVVVRGNTNAYQTYRRIVTAPDFLMTAQDFTPGPAALPISLAVVRTIPNFDAANKQPNLAGPGTINPPVQFAYNRAGVVLQNVSPFISGRGSSFFTWGSFDGTANPPIYYPNGTSIENLENQIIMQITTTNLPAGQVGTNYVASGGSDVQLTGSGGQPPYVWSQSQSSPGLPPGLSVFSNGTIKGTPTQDGVYDIIIRMTDAYARYVEQPFTIVVNP